MWTLEFNKEPLQVIGKKLQSTIDRLRFFLAHDVLAASRHLKEYCEKNQYTILDESRNRVLNPDGRLIKLQFGENQAYEKEFDDIKIVRIEPDGTRDRSLFPYMYESISFNTDGTYDLNNGFLSVKGLNYDPKKWVFTQNIVYRAIESVYAFPAGALSNQAQNTEDDVSSFTSH